MGRNDQNPLLPSIAFCFQCNIQKFHIFENLFEIDLFVSRSSRNLFSIHSDITLTAKCEYFIKWQFFLPKPLQGQFFNIAIVTGTTTAIGILIQAEIKYWDSHISFWALPSMREYIENLVSLSLFVKYLVFTLYRHRKYIEIELFWMRTTLWMVKFMKLKLRNHILCVLNSFHFRTTPFIRTTKPSYSNTIR